MVKRHNKNDIRQGHDKMNQEPNHLFAHAEETCLKTLQKNQKPQQKTLSEQEAGKMGQEPLKSDRLLRQVRAMIPSKEDKSS